MRCLADVLCRMSADGNEMFSGCAARDDSICTCPAQSDETSCKSVLAGMLPCACPAGDVPAMPRQLPGQCPGNIPAVPWQYPSKVPARPWQGPGNVPQMPRRRAGSVTEMSRKCRVTQASQAMPGRMSQQRPCNVPAMSRKRPRNAAIRGQRAANAVPISLQAPFSTSLQCPGNVPEMRGHARPMPGQCAANARPISLQAPFSSLQCPGNVPEMQRCAANADGIEMFRGHKVLSGNAAQNEC